MNRIFSAHVDEFQQNYKKDLCAELLYQLRELRDYLEKSHNVTIEIGVVDEETINAYVTIKERDYNKFILLNSYPFYKNCNTLIIDIDKSKLLSYDLEYETLIIWSEVDENGEYS